MLIQTKPQEAGPHIEAIQFLGDPTIHPMIQWSDEANKPIDTDRWCLKIPGRYEEVLCIGDWIIDRPPYLECQIPRIVNKFEFESAWQIVQ